MISFNYLMIFGAVLVVIVAGVVLWKWWKKTPSPSTAAPVAAEPIALTEDTAAEATLAKDPPPPPMLFAVNDNGNLDLTDFNNKLLDSSFGPNPKIYLSLMAQVTADVTESKNEEDVSIFISNVGTTKPYKVGDHSYIVNYTRLI
jgi:hypothetical protein